MAPISAPKALLLTSSRLFLLLVISVLTRYHPSDATQPPRTTEMVLYFQDFAAGPNATLLPVAGIAGKLWTFSQFGMVFVTDDFITETPDPDSPLVGRGQGVYVTSALDGSSTHVAFSIVFVNRTYNGSTLEIQGTGKQFEAVREYSVVGGTGKFRFARGYTTFETLSVDTGMRRGYSVIRCNVTVRSD